MIFIGSKRNLLIYIRLETHASYMDPALVAIGKFNF
jgi:hypothetical protein